tara:strand:+ start:887 stop:2755 length:1869 start_codon:yes stop_codon:yes gene_type:complete
MATQDVKIKITALDKTSGALKTIGSGLRTLTKPLLNMKTALVGLLGAGGITLLVRQSLLATDALSKTASKIGTTTEALSALQYAGKITGVEVNTMNMALQRFSRRASEAANGTGEAKGAIRELGIDARDLVKLPLDERMLVLADAFEGVKSESDKLRIAFKLFDSEGAALVNTLSLGRGGLSAMLGEAKALGVVMSSEAAQGVEDANDEFLKLNSIFKGILDQTTAALAPALKFIVESISKSLVKFGEAQGGFAEIGRKIATNLVNGFRIAGETIISGINGIIEKVNQVKNIPIRLEMMGAMGDIKALSKRIRNTQNAITQLQEKASGTRSAVDMSVWGQYGDNIDLAKQKLAENTRELERSLQSLARLKASLGDINPLTLEGLTGFTQQEIDEFFKNLTGSIKDFRLELGEPPKSGDGDIVNKYLESLEQLNRQLPQSEDLVNSFANNTMNSFTNGFTAAITGAENFADAMKSMAKSVVDDLIRMAVQYYITQEIFGAIVSAFGTPAPKGLNGQPAGPRTGPQVPDFNGGGFTGYGARAGGVDGKGGFPAILHPNESVLDHTRGQGSGVTIVQNINVTTGVQQTVRAEIANLLPQISNAAKSAVADARMRGGGFSKAMVGA